MTENGKEDPSSRGSAPDQLNASWLRRHRLALMALAILLGVAFGGRWWGSRWTYIVIHHSAGSYGDIEFLQQVHRERQAADPIDAIPYHFVIGNGNGLDDGEVTSDWRWWYGIWGSHVSAHNMDRNFRGIGICLVGNFESDHVSPRQYKALVTFTKYLMTEYGIPAENVTGHGSLEGESTKCPGKNFPMDQFKRDIQ